MPPPSHLAMETPEAIQLRVQHLRGTTKCKLIPCLHLSPVKHRDQKRCLHWCCFCLKRVRICEIWCSVFKVFVALVGTPCMICGDILAIYVSPSNKLSSTMLSQSFSAPPSASATKKDQKRKMQGNGGNGRNGCNPKSSIFFGYLWCWVWRETRETVKLRPRWFWTLPSNVEINHSGICNFSMIQAHTSISWILLVHTTCSILINSSTVTFLSALRLRRLLSKLVRVFC